MKQNEEKKTANLPVSPELIARAKEGEQAAYTELYETTSPALYRSVRSMVHDEDLAWDIVQESYIRAFRSLDKLGANEAFLPWLRRIAVNETARAMAERRPLRFSELEDEDGELPELPDLRADSQPELILDRQETSRLVREILADLPEQQNVIVGMRYYEDLSVREISELLKLAPGTVKAQLHRGRKHVEDRVRALEKQGVKLYGLSPMAFLVSLLRRLEPAAGAERTVLGTVLVNTPPAGASVGAAAGTGVGAASGAVTTVTAMTTGQAILHGLGAKIAAGVLCAALIGGGIWAGGRALENRNNGTGDWRPTETRMAVPVETEVPVVTEPAVTRSGKPGSPVDPETEAEIRALLDDGRPISPEMGHYVRALSCEYEKPTDVDLNRLFADFTGILSDGERAALRELRVNEEDYAWDSDREWAKVPSAELNAVLTELFGMDRSDFAAVRETTDAELLGGVWTYLPEFDCYYAFHTSTGLRSIQIEELLRTDDGRIFVNYVYQDESGEKMTAVLRAVDGHYQILANLPRDAALSDPDAIGTEPTDPAEPEPTEEELAAMERELTGEYFVKLPVAERSYFSNGKTRIWDDNGTIMKKDLASGETEALFTLETEAGNVIMPVGVTEDRLYIGWNSAERYANGGELVVYSVDYQNRDKKLITAEATEEYARGEMQVQFENGYLVLKAYRSDVGTRHTCAIDRNDKLIMEIHTCWDAKPVDGSFYYIYAPDWENYTWGDLSVAEQDEMMANMRYDVCRIDPDGDLTVLGSITMMYWAAYFWIDADAKEIVFDEHIQTWDLFTVQPTTLETLAFDELDPDTPVGVGIRPLRNDSEAIVFYTYFGAFGFDGTSGEPLFAVDFDKAFYGKGRSHTGCRISEDGTQLLLVYVENDVAEPSEYCLVDLKAGSYHRSSAEPEGKFLDREASGAFLPCREESESISGLCIPLNDEDFYPFREN